MNKLKSLAREIYNRLNSKQIQNRLHIGKKNAASLHINKEHFRELMENVKLIAVLLDEHGKVTYCNPYFLSITGYTFGEILGTDWFDRKISPSNPEIKEIFLNGLKSEKIGEHFENQILTKNGELLDIFWNNTLMRNTLGKAIGTASIGEDVTERKRIEKSLLYYQSLLKEIGRVAKIGAWEFDTVTGKGKWTEEAAKIHELDPNDEINIERGLSFYQGESRSKIENAINEALVYGKSYDLELELITSKGIHKWIQTIGYSKVENEKVVKLFGSFQDITEKKLIEGSLRDSEELFSKIFRASPIGISMARLSDGKLAEVNDVWCRLMEFSKEEAIGKNVEELKIVDTKHRSSLRKEILNKGSLKLIDSEITTKSGEKKSILTSAELIKIKGDHYSINLVIDITERKMSEEIIKNNERVLKLFVVHSPAAIAMFDREMKYIIASHRYLIDYDLNEQNLVGKSHYEIFPEISERWKEIHKRCLAGATEKADEDQFTRANGKLDWVRWEIHPWYERQGEIGGIILFSEVITERKRVEDELNQSNKILKSLYDNLNEAIFSFDALQNKMMQVSSAHEAVFGYPPAEFFKNPQLWYELILSEDKPVVDEGYAVLLSGMSHQHEVRIKRADGQIRWIEAKMKPTLDLKGKLVHIDGIVSDITDRKVTENLLKESEEKYRTIFENVQDVFYQTDLSGIILDISPSIKYFSEFSRDEIVGTPVANLYYIPDDRSILLNEIMVNGELRDYELKLRTKTGEVKYASINARLISDTDGRPNHIDGAIRDITDRKKAEEDLLKFKLCIQRSFEAIFITDINGIINYTNPAFELIYGYNQIEAIGKTPRILKSGVLPEEIYKQFWDKMLSKEYVTGEIVNKTKDGRFITVEGFNCSILDTNENIIGFVGIHRDITERKKAEEHLRKISRAVEQSPVSIVLTDKEGNIDYANPKVLEITGYKLTEIIGQNSRIFSSGDMPKSDYEVLWKTISSGKEWKGEFHNRKKNGELYWELASVSPVINAKGEITHYLAVKEDITEHKQIVEDLITAKGKAEESDNLKTSFLHNISHEIRTPLNAIVGFSSILTDPFLPSDKRQHFSDIIVQSSNQLLSIITDIINISTIEADQEKLTLKSININSRCKLIYEQFASIAKNKNISFRCDTPLSDSEAIIMLDETKILQILSNLLDNAFKFTTQGHVYYGYNLKDNYLEFFVEDTGIGIHADLQSEIFKRFRQVEISVTRQYGGSGLGLSISKAYVELHGGRIWLNSEIGIGSVFYFTVPYKKEKHDINSDNLIIDEIRTENEKPITLLVVEDEENNFMYIEELLSNANFTIIRAINAIEAIKICKSTSKIDIVLMDMKMPVMDGYEATKQIKQIRPNLPIIAQTAYSTDNDKNKALDCGCSDFISKPFGKELLLSKIREHNPGQHKQ